MAKFPEPPSVARLRDIGADVVELQVGTELWRVYGRTGRYLSAWDDFRYYGPLSTSRFDHHVPPPHEQERAILYAAYGWVTCIAEVFQDKRVIDRFSRHPWMVGFRIQRPVRLLDLTGLWPTRAGASMALGSGQRARARRWSRAIYEVYPDVEGLVYPSSMHANRRAVAFFERARDALPDAPTFHTPLSEPGVDRPLQLVAIRLGYRLV